MIVPTFPKSSETFIVSKFLGLLESGMDVHIVCQKSEETEWKRFPQMQGRADLRNRVHVTAPTHSQLRAAFAMPVVVGQSLARNMHQTSCYLRHGLQGIKRTYLDAELLRLQPDIIHFEFGALAVGRMYLKEWLGCRIVVSFRGYDLNYSGLENSDHYREVWTEADALHLVSEYLWRQAQYRGCPLKKKYAVIPSAIDIAAFHPDKRLEANEVGTKNRPLRLLSVGRLEWVKGYEYAIEAVARLHQQGTVCEYTIVGGGNYLEPIAFARHQFGLSDVVRLLGTQSRSEVFTQMQQADVFLHAAVSEGFCNAVIEAQAMGLPVVCTDAGGLPENVLDGETGFVVPRRNPQAMAEKLAILARDPSLRQRMSEAGHLRASTHFRLQDQISAFVQLYSDIMSDTNAEAK